MFFGGHLLAEGVNGAISYLATDGLGSATVALDGSGNATASTLYDPYGTARYTNGAMPGSRGFTGQHRDSTTGLDYYHARYYDAVAGQFVSADSVQDGLNRYAYVQGNPETFNDPTGHMRPCGDEADPCSGGGDPPPTTSPTPPTSPTPVAAPTPGCADNSPCTTHSAGSTSGSTNTSTVPNCVSDACAVTAPESQKICKEVDHCIYGSDPGGLFSLLAGELGDARTLVGVGASGLDWLISTLKDLKQEMDTRLNTLETTLTGTGVLITGLAAFPLCSVLCAAIGTGTLAEALLALNTARRLDAEVENVIGELTRVQDDMRNQHDAWVNHAQFEVDALLDPSVGYYPGDEKWWDETLSVNTYIYG